MYIVYILHSAKLNRFYVGYTSDLQIRIEFHLNSEARKFTHKADDWSLFYTIECKSKKQALLIEEHIKKMKSKTYIQNISKFPEMTRKLLDRFQEC